MLSKEIKSGLEDLILDRESFINDENDKDNIFVKDKKVLKSALDYIEELEAKEQKLIEKLEEKIEILEDVLDLSITDRKVAKYKIENLKEEIADFKEILKILKGEKE